MEIGRSPIVAPLSLTLCPISKPQQYFLEGVVGLFAEVWLDDSIHILTIEPHHRPLHSYYLLGEPVRLEPP